MRWPDQTCPVYLPVSTRSIHTQPTIRTKHWVAPRLTTITIGGKQRQAQCIAATSSVYCSHKLSVLQPQAQCIAATSSVYCSHKLSILQPQAQYIAATSSVYCSHKLSILQPDTVQEGVPEGVDSLTTYHEQGS